MSFHAEAPHNVTEEEAHFLFAETGVCSQWPEKIVCDGAHQLIISINITSGRLGGTLPTSLSQLSGIQNFYLDFNSISGTIPPEFSEWGTSLRAFSMQNNNLSGTLSTLFASWTSLKTFDVSGNQHLSGTLSPTFAQWGRSLDTFRVQNNSFYGTLPESYCAWGSTMLNFDVSSNALNGTLPPSYDAFVNLQSMYLYSNHFTGALPPQYSVFQKLQRFSLDNNVVTGELPPQYANWTSMFNFNVYNNSLRGTLPEAYALWGSAVNTITLSNNRFSGPFPSTWGASMTNLKTLAALNNSLSGTLSSSPSFAALLILAISFNNFSGILPSSGLPSLAVLDVQNNTYLSGPIALPSVLMATACGTQLCASAAAPFATYACLPPGLIGDNPDVQQVLLLFVGNSTSLAPCATTSPTPSTSSPSPNMSVNTTAPSEVNALTASSKAITSVAAATAAASAISGVDAADAQILVSILGSPCTCSGTETIVSNGDESVLLLALSPFSPFGSSWAAIGNSLLCCVLVAIHVLVFVCASLRNSDSPSRDGRRGASATLLGRWTSGGRHQRRLMRRFRFPNLSVSLTLLLIPGVVRWLVSIASSGDTSDSLAAAAMTVGVIFVVCGLAAVELVVYRHIDMSLTEQDNRTHNSSLLRYTHYLMIERIFAPVPMNVAKVVLPRGHWEPQSAKKSFGGIVSPFSGDWRRSWCVLVVVNLVVQILNSIGGSDAACNALQILTMIVLACASTFFAVTRPHRALLVSYLTCVSLLLSCVVTLLAMLCRLGSVDRSAVDGFGVVVSVAMMLMKAYTIGYPYAEAWLLERNGETIVTNESMVNGTQSFASETGEHNWNRQHSFSSSLSPERSFSFSLPSSPPNSPPSAVALAATVPPALRLTRSVEDVLREIIFEIAAQRNTAPMQRGNV